MLVKKKQMNKIDLKKEINKKIDSSGINYYLGYLMHKATGLDKDKCLNLTNKIIESKLNEAGKDFVDISNSKHKLSELSNEDLLKDNDKIIKG
jgi:hypothetical protein